MLRASALRGMPALPCYLCIIRYSSYSSTSSYTVLYCVHYCYGTQESDTDVKGNGSLLTPVEHAEGNRYGRLMTRWSWRSLESTHTQETGDTGDRRHRRKETRWIQVSRKQGVLEDDDDNECGIMTSDVEADHGEGFVCERIMNPIGTAFTEFQPS
ncbi:hypothetical protein DPX16_15367 [Anabarilius grahami]|uniref:Uncharacterized protein n=1 Tax=Anabarilius grahami TaxID=495550 RepID=A0A3N0XXP1_ANAGA|nr:hypothetical protein DPX16_15367 [Anabarilius grahami]